MRRILGILLLANFINLNGQDTIHGIVNTYFSVSFIDDQSNIVECAGEDLTGLQAGDKVIIMQMKGSEFQDTTPANWRTNISLQPLYLYAGHYEFLSVLSVNNATKEVLFTANFKRRYDDTQPIQLIKIYEAENAYIDATLTAPAWDSSTGGVVALVVYKKLELGADIDVSGKGFHGGVPVEYNADCRPVFVPDTAFFKVTELNRAGMKGESFMNQSFPYYFGIGSSMNGGGGGAGKYGGGGGGGNIENGGPGGQQLSSCTSDITQRASGSYSFSAVELYERKVAGADTLPAVLLGGGGGSSTQSSPGSLATAGGNGGGIIIILTDTIVGNGHSLIANGESVATTATAGAGGGGGGGAVIIDAETYFTGIYVNANGGDGGNSDGDCLADGSGGAGGGGAGGVLWYNTSTLPVNMTRSLDYGIGGTASCLNRGFRGSNGSELNDFEPLLNGFSFNAITGTDTICYGQKPDSIVGSVPKGLSPFTFQWIESNNGINWTAIAGATEKNYQPSELTDTMYYKRIVTNKELVPDTSLSVQILVYPLLNNFELTLRDTICEGIVPAAFTAESVTGGNFPNYSYRWESSTDQVSWTVRSTDELFIETNALAQTTYYRRIVESETVCVDTSKPDTLTVLQPITNNLFVDTDTTICNGLQAGIIIPYPVGGGDNNYSYEWRVSLDDISYNTIAGATGSSYNPAILSTGEYFFKRIVFSGNDNACADTTSIPRFVDVLPSLTNFEIKTDSSRYCAGDTPFTLEGEFLSPSGGKAGDYNYQWQVYNGSTWNSIPGATLSSYQPGMLEDTTLYRRLVVSGADYACTETSLALSIDILPYIINMLSTTDENICENGQPVLFSEVGASGGAGNYTYLWQQKTDSDADWSDASQVSGPNTNASYQAPELNDTTMYRRVAFSQICSDVSDPIEIIVYPAIQNNTITGSVDKFACLGTSVDLTGSTPEGGRAGQLPTYIWESSSDAVSWINASGADINFQTPNLSQATYYRRIVTSGETSQCKDTSAYTYLQINALPIGDIMSNSVELCDNENVSIDYNFAGNGPFMLVLGESTGIYSATVTASSGTVTFPMTNSADIRLLSLVDDSLCVADLSANTGLIAATVYDIPSANAGVDFEACGLSADLNAVLSLGTSRGYWSFSEGTFSNVDSSSPGARVTVPGYLTYQLYWTEINGDLCEDQDEVFVTFYEQPDFISAGEDIELVYEFNTQLDATMPTVGSGYWSFLIGEGEFSDPSLNNSQVTVYETGEYTLIWTVENGACQALYDSILLSVSDLNLFQGFSPNGDGINDLYTIDLLEGTTGKLTIIDRNGNMVFEAEGESLVTWDGSSFNGKEVPSDTYYFILEEYNKKPRTGYIEVRR